MATVVKVLNVKRVSGYLYHINKDGDVARYNRKTKKKNVVRKSGITKQKGYLYFLDGNGNVARAKMKRN